MHSNDFVKPLFSGLIEIINNPNSKQNFTLMPGDSIEILRKSNIVRIVGEVNNPGTFKFYYRKSLRDYIKIAGGLTVNAEPKEIWMTYPDGTSRQLTRFSPSPKSKNDQNRIKKFIEESQKLARYYV